MRLKHFRGTPSALSPLVWRFEIRLTLVAGVVLRNQVEHFLRLLNILLNLPHIVLELLHSLIVHWTVMHWFASHGVIDAVSTSHRPLQLQTCFIGSIHDMLRTIAAVVSVMVAILALLSVNGVGVRHWTYWSNALVGLIDVCSTPRVDILTVENYLVCKRFPVNWDWLALRLARWGTHRWMMIDLAPRHVS